MKKNCDNSNRSSTIIPDSDSEESERNWDYKLNMNNPFFEQIQQLNATNSAQIETTTKSDLINSCEEASEVTATSPPAQSDSTLIAEPSSSTSTTMRCLELPDPTEFGNGNPFLMFLCLTILLQHRDYIMQNNLDYNEMAMHFDKMVRKHNVTKVLNQARRLYQDYLRRYNEKVKNSANSK